MVTNGINNEIENISKKVPIIMRNINKTKLALFFLSNNDHTFLKFFRNIVFKFYYFFKINHFPVDISSSQEESIILTSE